MHADGVIAARKDDPIDAGEPCPLIDIDRSGDIAPQDVRPGSLVGDPAEVDDRVDPLAQASHSGRVSEIAGNDLLTRPRRTKGRDVREAQELALS
jgi:hypothetical protein